MRKNYLLIDYENVQPDDLAQLHSKPFHVKLFLGPHQTKIPFELARALQPLGSNVDYIKLDAAGPNALDFHIAYYLGVLSNQEPKACFHVISKDTGFDPLITYLRSRKIYCTRCRRLSEIPCLQSPAPIPVPTQSPTPARAPAPVLVPAAKAARAKPLPPPAPSASGTEFIPAAPPAPKQTAASRKRTAGAALLEADVQLALAHLQKLKAARPRKSKTLQTTLQTLFKTGRSTEQIELIVQALVQSGKVLREAAKVSYNI